MASNRRNFIKRTGLISGGLTLAPTALKMLYAQPVITTSCNIKVPLPGKPVSSLHYRIVGNGPAIETVSGVTSRTVSRTDHNSKISEVLADISMNRAIRRHPTMVVTGDLPRFAMMRNRQEAATDPNLIKLGDGRIRISVDGKSIWMDEAEGIRTIFLPHATEYYAKVLSDIECILTVAHAENWGFIASLFINNRSGTAKKVNTEFVFGGLSVHGRTFSAAYFNVGMADKEASETNIENHEGIALMTREGFPEKVAVTFSPGIPWSINDGRAISMLTSDIAPDEKITLALIAAWSEEKEDALSMVRNVVSDSILKEAEAYAGKLLESASINTPDQLLNAAYSCAIIELDRVWYNPCWLEGGHWWSAPWTNNFQISAAICLGQYDHARQTLEHYAKASGPAPNIQSNHSHGAKSDPKQGLPYYIHQMVAYLDATNDVALLRTIFPALSESIEKMWMDNDPDGDGLLQWRRGCNEFLYQADHLALPGNAASPSMMMAGQLNRLSDWAERIGEQEASTKWRAKASMIRENLIKKLWDRQDGAFFSHVDNQGLPHKARFYTDLVFPLLYSGLPEEYGMKSIDYLDSHLRISVPYPGSNKTLYLMKVGELKPTIFGNDNCMPTQMAEAAHAYAKIGRSNDVYNLLHSVALSATIFTESPGSFPERLGIDGKGEANYMFGNPIGSFLTGVMEGLFGLKLLDGGQKLLAAPALPSDWTEASIKLPYCSMQWRINKGNRGISEACINVSHDKPRFLSIQSWLQAKKIISVSINGNASKISIKKTITATQVFIDAQQCEHHEIIIRFKPETSHDKVSDISTEPLKSKEKTAKNESASIMQNSIQLDISQILNARHIYKTSRWASREPREFRELRSSGKIATEIGSFSVSSAEVGLAVAEYGTCDEITGQIGHSEHTGTLTVVVGKRAKVLNLLFANEVESRLTGSKVGEIRLRYETGTKTTIPLVVGINIDTLWSHFATETIPVPFGNEGENLKALQITCDQKRKLIDALISIEVADVQFALLGATVIPAY